MSFLVLSESCNGTHVILDGCLSTCPKQQPLFFTNESQTVTSTDLCPGSASSLRVYTFRSSDVKNYLKPSKNKHHSACVPGPSQ